MNSEGGKCSGFEKSHLMTSPAPGLPCRRGPQPAAILARIVRNLKRREISSMRTQGAGGAAGLDGVARPDIGLCPGDTAAAGAAHQEAPLRLTASKDISQDTPLGASSTHPHKS